MKRVLTLTGCAVAGVIVCGDSACQGPFPGSVSGERLEVAITGGPASSPSSRLPLSFTTTDDYTVTVTALRPDGSVDSGFNGYVRLSSEPGSVQAVSGPNTNGRNVQLQNGVATQVQVSVLAAYGNTFIVADDVGYVPADPDRVCTSAATCPPQCQVGKPCPPQCANGIDDNHNGLIDYPADPGCYLANDDTEDGGTYAEGVSPAIYYYIPRIADVNGGPEGGTAGTPFPNQAVNINCGYLGANNYEFSVIVTDVSSSGFYVTDLAEDAPGGGGFGSVYAYNFDAPPNMRQCDRLRAFGGTTADFYGFTEVNYPTWELEEWDPTQRPCLIPEPHLLAPSCTPSGTGPALPNCSPLPATGDNSVQMLSLAAALVRIQSTPGAPAPATWQYVNGNVQPNPSPPTAPAAAAGAGTLFHIGTLFGPAYPSPPDYTPTADATDCDLDDSGKVDRTNANELACANACEANLECSEYSNYESESQFNLVVQTVTWNAGDTAPTVTSTLAIQGNGSTDPTFNPVLNKGESLGSFTGTLNYFSGGTQYTIDARCQDDIIPLGSPPIPSDTACVHARTILDTDQGN
ncbi:MAG: hypothetical protein ACLQVI_34025 [Polyangiaceae bacterium]